MSHHEHRKKCKDSKCIIINCNNCDNNNKDNIQSGIFEISSITPTTVTDPITGITLALFSGTGSTGLITVAGPILLVTYANYPLTSLIPYTSTYVYTINIPIIFKKKFKNLPVVLTSIESTSGTILIPNVGFVNSVTTVIDNVNVTGFTLRYDITITDLTGSPSGVGANVVLHELLQPTTGSMIPVHIHYLAKENV
jgi:hypothetical protein